MDLRTGQFPEILLTLLEIPEIPISLIASTSPVMFSSSQCWIASDFQRSFSAAIIPKQYRVTVPT